MTLAQEIRTTESALFALRPAEIDDLAAVVELINRSSIDQEGTPLTNAEEVLSDWKRPSFEIESATRVAEMPDGQIIGYIEVWDLEPVPVQNWVWARVDPSFEGIGVGTALMDWAESRLQKTLARVPNDVRVVFRSAAVGNHAPTKTLFEDRNMEFVRRFWQMMIEFDGPQPEPAWPSGIRLSSYANRGDLRAIVRADQEAFEDHWGFVPQPEDHVVKQFREWTENQPDFDPSLWFLAMDGEEIAGICLCTRSRAEYPEAGWVNVLGVRRPWRKQGLGLALLHHAFGVFLNEGKKGVGLGVDSSNLTGATRLYEKAGMSVVKQSDAYEKEIRPGRNIVKS